MIVYNIVTAVCFAAFTAGVAYVIGNLIKKRNDRPSLIAFLRSFKRGKCVLVFIAALPLYFIGHFYAKQQPFIAFLDTVGDMFDLVVLKYEYAAVQALTDASLFYKVTLYYAFVLVTINAILFALSLTCQLIWQSVEGARVQLTRKDKLLIFGYNKNSVSIYNSDCKHAKVIVDDFSREERATLYSQKIRSIATAEPNKQIAGIFAALKGNKRFNQKFDVVINTQNDNDNLALCHEFVNQLQNCTDVERKRVFGKLRVYVFGDPQFEAVYDEVVASAFGCIHFVNKYQKIATSFVNRYPLTRFMDGSQIDYDTSLLKQGVEVNVVMIGFGNVNRQIFLTSVANNQFVISDGSAVRIKPVNYYVVDKVKAENDKNLNHDYYRFASEFQNVNKDDYLPLPEPPAVEHYIQMDVNDTAFYGQVRQVVSRANNDANFVIVAFGTDLENVDLAHKLVEKRREWGVDFTIFVKSQKVLPQEVFMDAENCYFFANEQKEVFDLGEITSDDIFRMAQMRNEIYGLEYTITHGKNVVVDDNLIQANRAQAFEQWFCARSQLERDSSLYCCLSLKSKLHLMGLDYRRKEEAGEALTEEQYLQIYAKDDLPDTSTYAQTARGKKIVHYTLDFAPSRRTTMAIQEHLRWNSFMLSKGMVPASREQIKTETVQKGGETKYTNGKNYALRRHGNITTFDGLVEFRKIVSRRENTSELSNDVIKYDYQLLDDAWWLLDENGFKIVKKQN